MIGYSLKTPCANCPFRTDVKPYITAGRVRDILTAPGEFYCHKTIKPQAGDGDDGDDGDVVDDSRAVVCAGFLIVLENEGVPNQMMRIAERLGLYDPSKLKMDAPVYGSVDDAIQAHKPRGDHAKRRKRRVTKAPA